MINHFDLEKFLKFRLPTWKNEAYWKWCSSQRRDGWEWHHLLGRKYYDIFVVMIKSEDHHRIHQGTGYKENEFEELFLQSLQNLTNYIIYKQTEKK